MIENTSKLEALLEKGISYISQASEVEMSKRPTPEAWSKKEILGHLIDSGINNLQRFIEIQFESKPYKMRAYDQDALVKANDYQHSELSEIAAFWLSVNKRIKYVMLQQSEKTLNYKINYVDGSLIDLRFLMEDYVVHLEHHLNQILKSH